MLPAAQKEFVHNRRLGEQYYRNYCSPCLTGALPKMFVKHVNHPISGTWSKSSPLLLYRTVIYIYRFSKYSWPKLLKVVRQCLPWLMHTKLQQTLFYSLLQGRFWLQSMWRTLCSYQWRKAKTRGFMFQSRWHNQSSSWKILMTWSQFEQYTAFSFSTYLSSLFIFSPQGCPVQRCQLNLPLLGSCGSRSWPLWSQHDGADWGV